MSFLPSDQPLIWALCHRKLQLYHNILPLILSHLSILSSSLSPVRHFTTTAFILDSRHRTLLLWHKRLQRWMPPGGHVDPDETPEETARRECKEETGLDVEIVGEDQADLFAGNPNEGRMLKKPIAMLLENIPESKERNEPAHQHMDFLFLARPIDESQALVLDAFEAREMRWFTRGEIEVMDERTEIFANVKRYILNTIPTSLGSR
ncbi:MAG: NUDIX domain-containing protein [Candidatus Peribacteraceae bacterium]|nr:NUDIX domain-containing protein [Candidatus Peribacteraceae bacterium]